MSDAEPSCEMPAHYLACANDRCHSTSFSVVREGDTGEIERFECAQCGCTNVERGPDAP